MATARRKIRLGELLVQQRVISELQLTSALTEQKRTGRKLGRVLADLGFLSETSSAWPTPRTCTPTMNCRRD